MRIPGSYIRPAQTLPVPQQQNRLAGDGQALLPARPTSTETVRAVVGAREAESMLLRTRPRQTDYPVQARDELKSHKAMAAYGSLVQNAEREYVSSVLGIDVYA